MPEWTSIVEYAGYQYRNITNTSPFNDALPPSPSWTGTTQEPYYSNKDISIVHDIVASAQEKLEAARGPKPLPAAALFKAYDEVLPRHGIDPDNDNHLSRLIFRVGGEKGHGTLSDKFQAVLDGMGIVLEFEDISVSSVSASNSPRPQVHRVAPRHQIKASHRHNEVSPASVDTYGDAHHETREGAEQVTADDVAETSFRQSRRTDFGSNAQNDWMDTSQGHMFGILPDHKSFRRPPQYAASRGLVDNLLHADKTPALKRPSLLSALDRWKMAVGRRSPESTANFSQPRPQSAQLAIREQGAADALELPASSEIPRIIDPKDAVKYDSCNDNAAIDTAARLSLQRPTSDTTPNQKLEWTSGEYPVLLQRAARARQIYLASRAFNHWAEKTATRLEREAIARRHMIRFRCFLGWSQTPNSRSSAVDNLRAATAVQKLQRAVAHQEELLSTAAVVISKIYNMRLAKRSLESWSCSAAEDRFRQQAVSRTRQKAVFAWMGRSRRGSDMSIVALQCRKQNIAHKWIDEAHKADGRLTISRQVGMVRPLFAHLRAWWDHTEAQRRAETYRASRLWASILGAFEQWNLSARAQAFMWREDYTKVTQAAHLWAEASNRHRRQAATARQHFATHALPHVGSSLLELSKCNSFLQQYAQRARLFIFSNRFLRVLDHGHEKIKIIRKKEVRRQLMVRYKEVSASRKRRQFGSTLAKWRSLAQVSASALSDIERHKDTYQMRKELATLSKWSTAAEDSRQVVVLNERKSILSTVNLWDNYIAWQELREMKGWDDWAQRKQWLCLKSWSISTLQRSGQVHTASMVRHRHELDKRGRTFQRWRQISQEVESKPRLHWARTTPHAEQGLSGRSSWRTRASRLDNSYIGASTDTPLASIETPTRWTGQALSMGNSLAFPMSPVKEAVEDLSEVYSMDGDRPRQNVALGHRGIGNLPRARPGFLSRSIASTTPLAPVPTYLQRDTDAATIALEREPSRALPPFPSHNGPRQQNSTGIYGISYQGGTTAKASARISKLRAPATPASSTSIYRKGIIAGIQSAPQASKEARTSGGKGSGLARYRVPSRSVYKSRTQYGPSESVTEPHGLVR